MKNLTESKEIKWLGDIYRITKYADSRVVRIEILENDRWFRKGRYKTIYFSHPEPLREFALYCQTFPAGMEKEV